MIDRFWQLGKDVGMMSVEWKDYELKDVGSQGIKVLFNLFTAEVFGHF